MFRCDTKCGKDSIAVSKTANFKLLVMKKKAGGFRLKTNDFVHICMTFGFFVEEGQVFKVFFWKKSIANAFFSIFATARTTKIF